MTQQQFAGALGVSINSIARYETGRVPEPRKLLLFASRAAEAGRADIQSVFERELKAQVGDRAFGSVNQLVAHLQEVRHLLYIHYANASGKPTRDLQKIEIDVCQAFPSIEHALKIATEIDPSVPKFTPTTEAPGTTSISTPGYLLQDEDGDE